MYLYNDICIKVVDPLSGRKGIFFLQNKKMAIWGYRGDKVASISQQVQFLIWPYALSRFQEVFLFGDTIEIVPSLAHHSQMCVSAIALMCNFLDSDTPKILPAQRAGR